MAERFYAKRFGPISQREGWLSVYDTMCALYREDNPDDIRIRDLKRFDRYCETMRKQVARGKNEQQAMIEGHWDEWFQWQRHKHQT
jgi:hypothetical protein